MLIAALSGERPLAARFLEQLAEGEPLRVSALVVFEYLRGPRSEIERHDFDRLFPDADRVSFGALEATAAAALYRSIPRARGREIDLAIAACAIVHGATLWSLNPRDFRDIPGLRLAR